MAELGSEGIWLSTDRLRSLDADLFEQSARQTVGDVWEQQASAAAPDMLRQAQADEAQRQAAIDAQRQQQREQVATQFEAAAPQMAVDHVTTLTGDPDLATHLGNALASPSPQDALQPPSAADTSQTPPVDLGAAPASPAVPAAAPALVTPTSPLPSSFAAPVTPTAPSSPPVAPSVAVASATPTTAGISGGGDLSGRVGAAGQAIMSAAADTASWLGDQGQKALQAVLLTEGGLAGARGDKGQSAGPLQFYTGGQLANFAAQHGLTQSQAMAYVEQNPDEAVRWAIGTPDQPGYLGRAILAGQQAGLQGPDLATYAQQHGQVSVSPERAGQNWQSLFGQGADVISGAASGALRVVNAAVQNVLSLNRPSQFGVGLSPADAYAACGPVAAMAFARATGRNPTAQEAVELAKSVGWSAAQGMAGPSSEVELLKKMGVASHLEAGADPNKIAQDVNSGNPVIISTPGHYFTADGARTAADGTQEFHVGTSGTDLRRGSEWMSLAQMQQTMGAVQGTLYMDRQPGDGPSVAVQQGAQQAAAAVPGSEHAISSAATPAQPQGPLDTFKQKLGDAFSDLFAPLQNLFGGSSSTPPTPEGGGYGAVPPGGVNPLQNVQSPQTGNPLLDVLGTGASALGSAVHTVGLPFGGASPEFPTGGPLAGPGVGIARQVAGFEQLAAENPEYAQLQAQRDALLAQQPANAAAAGGPDVIARAQQIRGIEDRMRQIASQTDIPASAQRNPNIQSYETQGALEQGAVATALAPAGLASGVPRAAASVLADPGSAPFLGLQAAGDLARVGGRLATPVDTTVAPSLVDSGPLSLTPVVVRGAAAGGVAGGYQASQQPGATPADVATGVLTGAGLGAARGAVTSVLPGAGRVVGPLARIASDSDAGGRVPLTGAGILQGALDALGQYPAEARQAIEDTVAKAQAEGTAASTVGAMVQRWTQQNPLSNFRQPPSSSTTDVLQGLLDQARTRGANPQVLDSMQGQLEQLKTVASSATSAAANGAAATSSTSTARSLPGVSELLGPSGPQPGQLSLGLDVPELHPRIQELLGDHPEYAQIAQDGLVDLINSKADLGALGRYWAGVQASAGVPTGIEPMDWIRALRNGAMAGGLQTLGHVGLSVPLQTLWSIPREAVASVLRGKPEQIPATIAGTFKGFAAGWEAASQQLRYGLTEGEAMTGDISQASKALQATSPLQAGAYRAAEGLVSTHGLGQMMIENVGFYQKLTQQAWSMAKDEGLTGSAFTNRVEDILSNVTVDPKYQDLLKEAQLYGQKMSFRGPQGRLGEAARGFANAGIAGNLLIPFETIAYHVLTQGVERTPLGALGTALDVARAKTPIGNVLGVGPYAAGFNAGTGAVTPLAERMANNVLGLGMLAAGLEAASRGLVTGAGPEDPTERRTWLDQGNQPESFLIGGRYVSSHTFGPLAYPFESAAAAVEAAKYAKPGATPEEVMADGLRRMGQYLTNETWLRGVGQITDALSAQGGAGNKIARLVANYGESFVPQSALLHNVEQATDPLVRQPASGDAAEQFQSYYPGLAGQLPPRQSLLGEPVANPNQGLGVLAPTARGRPDPVVQLFAGAGMGVPNPPAQIKVTSKYSMNLQPDEQRQYQDLRGQALREITQEFLDEPAFASLPIEKRQSYLQKAMTKADDIARKQFLDRMPDDQIEQRVLEYQGLKTPRPFASVGSP